jgi:hypothetical protein
MTNPLPSENYKPYQTDDGGFAAYVVPRCIDECQELAPRFAMLVNPRTSNAFSARGTAAH